MRIIAAVDIMGGSVVRLVKGDPANKTIYSSDPVETARKLEAAGADMLHVVDLDAAFGSGNNTELATSIAAAVKIPVEFAGGIRTLEKADEMLTKASRVVLGTIAYTDPEAVRKLVRKNPGRVVVSIDQVGGKVMVKGWKESAGTIVADAISRFSTMGVDEFLLTSIERDGTLLGPDVRTLAEAAESARIIASGGISDLVDIVKVRSAGCTSVILGKAMYDGKVSIGRVKALA
jgi:phosphoribosylformimino-5-aminoimidazole carboxamide ribotide isomerase